MLQPRRSISYEAARATSLHSALAGLVLWIWLGGLGTSRSFARDFTLEPPERYTLENGLEVILAPDARQPKVAFMVSYRVGSRDDPQGYSGLAHMVEHMTFRGSRHLEQLQMLSSLERAGAQGANGLTHPDWTAYYATVPSSQVPLVLWLESERMAFTLEAMTDDRFQVEREVVLNEVRQGRGLGSRVPDFLSRALYPRGHPYHDVARDETDEEAFVLDHVRWFYQKWYRPDNATLTLVGQFDSDRAKAEIERYFGPIRGLGDPPARAPAPPVRLAGSARLEVRLPARRDSVRITWSVPCVFAECGHELLMLETLLANNSESSLKAALIGPGRPASDVSFELDPFATHTRVTISADVAIGAEPEKVVDGIDRVLTATQRKLSAQDVRDAKIALSTAVTSDFEPLLNRAFALTHFRRPDHTEDLYDPGAELQKIADLTPSKLKSALRRYLPLDRRVVMYERQDDRAPGGGRLRKVIGNALPPTEEKP